MNARLGRMPWALVWLFLSVIAWMALASDQCSATPTGEEVRLWIAQLSGDDFAARETAATRLADTGEAAIVPLIECLRGTSPEAAWRATAILTQLAENCDTATYAKIVGLLARRSAQADEGQSSKLNALIVEIGAKRLAWRRNMALEKIRAYGGRFSSDLAVAPVPPVAKPTEIALPVPPPDLPPDNAAPAGGQIAVAATDGVLIADAYVSPLLAREITMKECGESLTIDQHWRGGDAGLTPLCDLPDLYVLSLNRAPLTDAALDTIAQLPAIQSLEIEDMSFSSAALNKFRQRQPKARVVSRNSKVFEVSAER